MGDDSVKKKVWLRLRKHKKVWFPRSKLVLKMLRSRRAMLSSHNGVRKRTLTCHTGSAFATHHQRSNHLICNSRIPTSQDSASLHLRQQRTLITTRTVDCSGWWNALIPSRFLAIGALTLTCVSTSTSSTTWIQHGSQQLALLKGIVCERRQSIKL